jgi:hypothetical protein
MIDTQKSNEMTSQVYAMWGRLLNTNIRLTTSGFQTALEIGGHAIRAARNAHKPRTTTLKPKQQASSTKPSMPRVVVAKARRASHDPDLVKDIHKARGRLVAVIETWAQPDERDGSFVSKDRQYKHTSPTTKVTYFRIQFFRSDGRVTSHDGENIILYSSAPVCVISSVNEDPKQDAIGMITEADHAKLHPGTQVGHYKHRVDCVKAQCSKEDCPCASFTLHVGPKAILAALEKLPKAQDVFKEYRKTQ